MMAPQIFAQTPKITGPSTSGRNIETKAAALTSPDRDKVKDLTDAVLADAGVVGPLVDTMSPLTKTVSEAEYQFHTGTVKPVKESQVIEAVNSIAAKMNAPKYAYTGKYEVRSLRMRMATETPHLTGRRSITSPHHAKINDTRLLDDEMSPLEAVHVTTTMLYQKMLNPAYQMTDDERVARRKKDPQHAPTLTADEAKMRFEEMHGTVTNALNYGNISWLKLTTDSLTSLGIGQNGSK